MSLRTSFQNLIRRDPAASLRERAAETAARLAASKSAADTAAVDPSQPDPGPTDWHSPPPGFMAYPASSR